MWTSELAAINTLDNLLSRGLITLEQYLERIPDNLVPRKKELIEQQNSVEREDKNDKTKPLDKRTNP